MSETININVTRIRQTVNSTISKLSIAGTHITGYILERPGPCTTQCGLRRRVPVGTYQVRWHNGTHFKNVMNLWNDEVPQSRAILMHQGNYPKDTDGCLLAGETVGADFVGNSVSMLKKINDYVNSQGIAKFRVVITEEYEG